MEVNLAIVAAMEKSCNGGVNLEQKKPKCLSFVEETMILNHPIHRLGSNKPMLKY